MQINESYYDFEEYNCATVIKPTTTEYKISSYDLPRKITELSINNLMEIQTKFKTRLFKQKTQNEVIFACIWKAFHQNGMTLDTTFLQKYLFGDAKFSSNKAIGKYLKDIEPSHKDFVAFYIDNYISNLEFQNYDTDDLNRELIIMEIYNIIDNMYQDAYDVNGLVNLVNQMSIKNTTIGIITYYLSEVKTKLSCKVWSKSCYLTPACIKKYKTMFMEQYKGV